MRGRLSVPWNGYTSTAPNTNTGQNNNKNNGFAWIMYLGARNPYDTQAVTPEKGIGGGYVDIT